MVVFPFAKINLGLNVIRLRPDGFRDIESVMLPIPLEEALEVLPDPNLRMGVVEMVRSGRPVPGDVNMDLCVRAYQALHARRPLPGVRVHLHKAIPIGAGLGGGSSDGAHMLQALDRLFKLGLAPSELHDLAASLGSDCAFFLEREAQLALGRGERLQPVELNIAGMWLVLVDPGIHVSTADAYSSTPLSGRSVDLPSILQAAAFDMEEGAREHHGRPGLPQVPRTPCDQGSPIPGTGRFMPA
ncbi:MAG: 4-(cytidine 5'-diphospho)-2-C-methyl-D-erythritol kinase [Flavobacteriales bacterium]|nr:4-(cytidine 5'-diphospho)-2-C-methyl-D-erythritol kinase [Flavobacteriales bacterium]